ncbi:MAG: SARP family transcriptional regulator [Thermoleophilaceae bacterium]|nr:SARP family transcriptional regulator [Thermoleophilaceae bacterium]
MRTASNELRDDLAGHASVGIDHEPPPFRLSMLGGFELSCAGAAFALPLAAQRVLAFVALQERPVQRAYVAGRLWLNASDQHASASLRTTLWRAHLPAGHLLAATTTHLSLGPAVRVDLHDVLRCAQHVLRHTDAPTRDDLACLLHGGDVLPDWYDDWLVFERERVRQLRLLALEALCDHFSRAGRHSEAIQAGLAAVAGEPLRESAHRVLMRAHLADGNPGEAIRQYRILETLLHRALGLRPSPEMGALVTRCESGVT